MVHVLTDSRREVILLERNEIYICNYYCTSIAPLRTADELFQISVSGKVLGLGDHPD